MSPYSTRVPPVQFRALSWEAVPARHRPSTRRTHTTSCAELGPPILQKASGKLTVREVIVALDGSRYAEYALPWAIQIATLAGTSVRLVHVHPHMQSALHGRRSDLYREFDQLLRAPMEDYIAGVMRRVARASSVPVMPTVVDGRHIADSLSELLASTADILVMATRGRSVLSRTLHGSPLDAILQHREAPILHVRGYSCPVDFTARPSLRRVLVPLDGSSESTAVMGPVATLSKLLDGSQTLFRVIQSPGVFSCGDESSPGEEGILTNSPVAYVDEIRKAWRSELPHLQTSVVWSDAAPADAILSEADEQEVDYIAIATRPRGRLNRLLRPGVFDRLVRRARTPVLVVKQPS
jgi:nucleotide-binding universal stress UspA family protein